MDAVQRTQRRGQGAPQALLHCVQGSLRCAGPAAHPALSLISTSGSYRAAACRHCSAPERGQDAWMVLHAPVLNGMPGQHGSLGHGAIMAQLSEPVPIGSPASDGYRGQGHACRLQLAAIMAGSARHLHVAWEGGLQLQALFARDTKVTLHVSFPDQVVAGGGKPGFLSARECTAVPGSQEAATRPAGSGTMAWTTVHVLCEDRLFEETDGIHV
jgi:hypothetical protein